MKYDWVSLKKEFILKNSKNTKYTLKTFSEEYKIPYSVLRKNANGWIKERAAKQEQKNNKVTELTLERQAVAESDMNAKHYQAAETLIDVMLKTMSVDSLIKSPKSIATLAKALKDAQSVQRVAIGADRENKRTRTRQILSTISLRRS